MLNLTLIGDKAVSKIKPIIEDHFDNVKISVFHTIQDFCETADMRTIQVDRIILLQDAFQGKPNANLLTSFNDYLGKHFPAIRLISLLNDVDSLELFSSIFISPNMVHIKASSMKPRTIYDLVEQSIDTNRKKYGYVSENTVDDTLSEIVEDDFEGDDDTFTSEPLQQNTKKSRGIFSIFGKGKKKDKSKRGKNNPADQQRNEDLALTGGIPVYQPDFDSNDDFKGGNFGFPSSENQNQREDQEFDDLEEMDSWATDSSFGDEIEPDVDFTMFDGHVNVGHSNPQPTHDSYEIEEEGEEELLQDSDDLFDSESFDDFDFGDSNDTFEEVEEGISFDISLDDIDEDVETDTYSTTTDFDSESDFPAFSQDEEDGFQLPSYEETDEDFLLPDEEESDFNTFEEDSPEGVDDSLGFGTFNNSEDEEEELVFTEPEFDTGLDLELEDVDDQQYEEEQPPIVIPDLKQQREKFDDVKRDVLSKGVDTTIPDYATPQLPTTDFDIQDVTTDLPEFSDLEDLEQQYNDKNIKVVEVERIVERVVEKPIRTGGTGVSKKVYPTGVRTIIFTGDRKSGVTRTALQSAMFFGKTERTLFVDFDVKRKGSLLFYGIDNIIQEHDNVQNGLLNLKSTSMLKHVVYNFVKGGFDALISLYGETHEKEDLIRTQRILSTQKDYSTVIIDCPLENLHLLEDILLYSEIVICMESDLQSTVNTVMGLAEAYEEDSKLAIFLYNNAKYLLTANPDPKKFRENLDYVSEIFSLDEEETDWSLTPILGTSRDLAKILNRM